MSRIYAQQKRPGAKAATPSHEAPAAHTPSLVSGQSNAALDAMMQAKYQQHFLDNQIPTAEAEADRIAASVSGARTPEEVKTQLGEKMGADFSNVTFHTDSAARGMADTMGARAYTTGSDVYFGSGGFDPGVAAHELVHTVQQGMVGSTMQTTSAPTGGVQMKSGNIWQKMPNWIKKLRVDYLSKKLFKSNVSSLPDLDSQADYLEQEYHTERNSGEKWGYASRFGYEEPTAPELPTEDTPRAISRYERADRRYQRDMAKYEKKLHKDHNDAFGFRNHWWQFWRPKEGDFRSLARKYT